MTLNDLESVITGQIILQDLTNGFT